MSPVPETLAAWRLELVRLLDSDMWIGDRLVALTNLGAQMGFATGERLLDTYPDLLAYRPTLRDEFNWYIVAQEITEARAMLSALGIAPAPSPDPHPREPLEIAAFEGGIDFARSGLRPMEDMAAARTYAEALGSRASGAFEHLGKTFADFDSSGCQTIAMVGCGWRPTTAFYLHDRIAGARILGLDTMPSAVETAQRLAARFGSPRLAFEVGDGLHYDFAECDLVFVASMVAPKPQVISRVLDTARPGTRIILWEPASLGRLWAEYTLARPDPRLEIAACSDVWRMTQFAFGRKRSDDAAL